MAENHKKRKFLNMPKYPGGSLAFKAFIAENLRYPSEALNARVEGSVMVGYDIRDTGKVENSHIIKGIGYGCDEEALRLIGLLVFETVKNRGVRVKMTTKTTIHFRLPGLQINYASTEKTEPVVKESPSDQKPSPVVYEYTISF
jgi:protein TonB